jgi:CubicO group peptidase (beta-lactamase class C family)
MLLSHKAGLGDFLDKRTPEIMRKGTATASDLLTFFENDEPSFEPGTSFQYSNNGLILAGAIVELVSGEPYYDYVRRHIFKPLGMSDTDPNNRRHQDPLLVTPYTHFTETAMVKDWIIADADLGTPAGGAISSAEDLLRFADGLRRGKLVSLDTLMEITKSREIRPIIGDYGYAFDINEVHGRKVIGHGGEFLGVSTLLAMIQDTPYNIVVLSNQDPDAALRVSGHLVSMAAAASWKSGN